MIEKLTLRKKVAEMVPLGRTTGEIFAECKSLGLSRSYHSTAIEIHKYKKSQINKSQI